MEDADRKMNRDRTAARPSLWWWLRQLLLTGIACFFVCFGISVLAASYGLGDPFSFIMTFFGASLMILISLVMVLGFVLRMRRATATGHRVGEEDADP
ncbi:hypothetical protein DSCA_64130 [Desulfosarcina alkanivorans]|jgi:hypothetical protein|uniref:Uncharacterized protein n=1 Tax=Desulfosarcina alkanivorans TaxID=571177 RepID=A0A5K7YWY5_9BACT|nr:hypothetical protein [Desulfosarcina alkanivorans]BBO72483.1 hypothetical protein DSCA_64130 [Desulfosarcina alkanivorans]